MACLLSGLLLIQGCGKEPKPDTPSGPEVIHVQGVTASVSATELTEGETAKITVTFTPSNVSDKSVTFSSSATDVASVDDQGNITAKSPGEATITVTTKDGGKTATVKVTVKAKPDDTIAVTGVALDKDNLLLIEGDTDKLTATVQPADATNKGVKFNSSDSNVVTVDNEGNVTAVGVGTATITVTTDDGGKQATCAVTVEPKELPVEGITLNPESITLKEGESFQLNATISPAGADQEMEWASQNDRIATVDDNGLVTAVKAGQTGIAVRSKAYPDKQAVCQVTVTPDDALKGIRFPVTEINIVAGESQELNIIYDPEYAANKNVTWSSSDSAIASVTDGTVTGINEGTATITATSEEGGFTANCLVTVSKTAGPFVYTKEGRYLRVNGSPDPREGTFNMGYNIKFSSVLGFNTDGKDLFSFEAYYDFNKYKYYYYLCKNRAPFKDLSAQVNNEETFVGLSVRNGVYALLFKVNNTYLKVIKVKDGDDSVYEYPINGISKSVYLADLSVAPDGGIHISAYIVDSFDVHRVAWIVVSNDGKVSSTFIDEEYQSPIDISDSGDIYIFAKHNDYSINKQVGYLYKNGILDKEIDSVEYNYYLSLKCLGNDVYTVADDYPNSTVRVHKNGQTIQTLVPGIENIIIGDKSLWVTSNGDVYVCLEDLDNPDYRIYKNGKLLYSTNNLINYFCVVE